MGLPGPWLKPAAGMLFALAASLAWAQAPVLEVIELRHRTAEELLPVVQTALEPDGSASALDNKLIIKATPAQIRDLRTLLKTLDVPARQLLITLRQLRDDELRERDIELAGRVEVGEGEVVLPGEHGTPSRPQLRLQDDRTHSTLGDTQSLRVLEGREASFFIGQTLPTVLHQRLPDGRIVETVHLQEARTGFTVRPQLQGDQVRLDISPRQDRSAADGSIEIQSATTTVTSPLGEWIDLTGVMEELAASTRGILSVGSERGSIRSNVLVKVELAP